MATIATLKKQIETLEKGINSPATPDMFKDGMRKNLEQKKSELEALESKGSTPKKSAPEKKKSAPKAAKPTPKAKVTPAPTPKKSGGNPQMKEAAKLAKELREKDSSLTHQQAMKKAWQQVKGGSKKEDSGSGKKLSLAQFKKRYEENEDNNYHSENVVLLAENFGDKEDVKEAKDILAKHRKEGHLTDSLNERSYSLHKKLWAKYKAEEKGETPAKRSEAAKKKAKDLKTRVKSKLTPVPNQYKSGSRTHSRDKDRDGVRTAKRAGKRISKDGNVYYEYRENRADANIGRKSYRKPKLFAKGGEVSVNALYSKLLREYTKEGYEKMGTSFNSFLNTKKDTALENKNYELYSKIQEVEEIYEDNFYAKGGKVDRFKDFTLNKEGNLEAFINGKKYETIYRDDRTALYDLFENGKIVKSSKDLRSLMSFPQQDDAYTDSGSLGSEMYKIVDINGEDVHVNMTEKDVIEFADSLGYYDALDNEEEPIYDIDSATALIEMDGDYTVIKVSKEGDSFGRGGNTGNYNTGRSWHQDRNLFAQGQDYEVQYRKHRKA